MMQRKHPSEAMTGAPGALPGEAIRVLIQIVALHNSRLWSTSVDLPKCQQDAAKRPLSAVLGQDGRVARDDTTRRWIDAKPPRE
jgi:hypothetical protein